MKNNLSFFIYTGTRKLLMLGGILLAALLLALYIVKGGMMAGIILCGIPIIFWIIVYVFRNPHTGLIISMIVGFISVGLTRYINAPLGLSLDLVLLLTLIAAIFYVKKEDVRTLNNGLVWMMVIWTVFTILEIFNPEASSIEAWFYAARAITFYPLLLVILTFLIFRKQKHMDLLILIWLAGGIISALYGMKQLYLGLDSAENKWMAEGGAETHLLFGKLRVFSFYSDAGQFGAFMSYATMLGGILAMNTEKFSQKIFYLAAAFLCFYGMAISGTRGAMFVFTGFFFYFILTKKFKVVLIGLVLSAMCYYVLKFTYLGQGNYHVQRMRSAVKPEDDASFQVRLENQEKLSKYMDTRPFGGGIGTIGYWGQRFSPGTFLAETPPDSHFVRIWAETGVIGLYLHLFILLYILIKGFYIIYNIRDPILKQKMMAFYAGALGILVASYGNQVISQMPTIVFFSISVAYIFQAPAWDKEISESKNIPETKRSIHKLS